MLCCSQWRTLQGCFRNPEHSGTLPDINMYPYESGQESRYEIEHYLTCPCAPSNEDGIQDGRRNWNG